MPISDPAETRRTTPKQRSLEEELRVVLAAAGLPISDHEERTRARGLVLTEHTSGDVFMEWFTSLSLREAASLEQRQGIPQGRATSLHVAARSRVLEGAAQILGDSGYRAEWQPNGTVLVRSERDSGPTTLAADIRRLIGHLSEDDDRDPEEVMSGSLAEIGEDEDAPDEAPEADG